VAGTVAAVGGDVSRFKVGDEVFGISRGSFAEYAAARAISLRRPDHLRNAMSGIEARSTQLRRPAGVSGQQGQRIQVPWPNHGKVTAVQRRHIGQSEPFG
jgi:NADPH:quinone reductase-like Zn-dependent oxidoreductase